MPSLCNGIYGFRPSVEIVPHGGVRDLTTPGTDRVRLTAGPMATSLRDIALSMETTLQTKTWNYDSTVISVPRISSKPKIKVHISLAEDDGVYTLSPPVRRGLKEASNLLRRNDSVEIITLPNVRKHYLDLIQYFTLLGVQVSSVGGFVFIQAYASQELS